MLERGKVAKITPNRFYLKNDCLIRIIKINKRLNSVHIFRYDTYKKDIIEYDTAHFGLVPVFKIGDVAKMLNRKPDTIRKYERSGLIPPGKKFFLQESGKVSMRLYTEKDIAQLAEFFSQRGNASVKYSAINQKDLVRGLQARFQKIKNVGEKYE